MWEEGPAGDHEYENGSSREHEAASNHQSVTHYNETKCRVWIAREGGSERKIIKGQVGNQKTVAKDRRHEEDKGLRYGMKP